VIGFLIGSLLASGPSVESALLLDPPAYDERISHAACGERVVIVRVRNVAGAAPLLTSVTIDGVEVAAPQSLSEEGLLAQFREIGGAEIECERETGVPHITFKGFGKQDDESRRAFEACMTRRGVWLNDRWERYEAIEGKLRRTSTLTRGCAGGEPGAPESAETRQGGSDQ
jgi:hypothetical protein